MGRTSYDIDLPVSNPTDNITHIRVSVDYSKGGTSYFDGRSRPRGIYIHANPIAITKDGFVRCLLGHGGCCVIEQLKAFSTRKLHAACQQVAEDLRYGGNGMASSVVLAVLGKESLSLVDRLPNANLTLPTTIVAEGK